MSTEKRTIVWRGLNVTVTESREPTLDPWDGDEPLDPGCEGYDLLVSVELEIEGQAFKAHDSICGNWIRPNAEGFKYLDSQIEELTEEALVHLAEEIERVAGGADVRKEEARKLVAMVVSGLPSLNVPS